MWIKPCLVPLLAGAMVCGTSLAGAESESESKAEALFVEGRQLLEKGDNSGACAKFSESYRVEPASGTLLGLAICHENSGLLATAWSDYRTLLERVRAEGRIDREQLARDRLLALQEKLSTLTILVPAEARAIPGLEIHRDGLGVGPAMWSLSVPVDPGKHSVSVSAPDRRSWNTVIDVVADRDRRTVVIPVLEMAGPIGSVEPPPGSVSRASTASQEPAQFQRRVASRQRVPSPPLLNETTRKPPTWLWTTFGVGVVAAVAGAGTGGIAWLKKGSLDCANDHCPASRQGDVDTYGDLRTISSVSFAISAAALATGVALWAFLTHDEKLMAPQAATSSRESDRAILAF